MLRDGLLREVLQEGEDLLVEAFAGTGPAVGATQNLSALAELRKMEFLGPAGAEIFNFFLQDLEEDQLESVAGIAGGAGDRNGERWGEGEEIIRDGIAADATQHAFHAFEEIFDRKQAPWALVLQVVQDPIADVVDERKVCAVAALCRALERDVDPSSVIAGDLMAADFEDWEFSDETDHDGSWTIL